MKETNLLTIVTITSMDTLVLIFFIFFINSNPWCSLHDLAISLMSELLKGTMKVQTLQFFFLALGKWESIYLGKM